MTVTAWVMQAQRKQHAPSQRVTWRTTQITAMISRRRTTTTPATHLALMLEPCSRHSTHFWDARIKPTSVWTWTPCMLEAAHGRTQWMKTSWALRVEAFRRTWLRLIFPQLESVAIQLRSPEMMGQIRLPLALSSRSPLIHIGQPLTVRMEYQRPLPLMGEQFSLFQAIMRPLSQFITMRML